MATLAGNTIAETYPLLLKIASGGIDGDLRIVEDGDGTESALSIATDSVLVRGSGVKLYFHDADGGEHISGNGSILSIVGGNEIDLTATAIDINGTVDMSSTLVVNSTTTIKKALSSDTQTTPETILTLGSTYSSTGSDGGAGSGTRLEFNIPDDDTNPITGSAIAGLKENADDGISSSALAFYTSQDDTTLDEAMRISSTGKVGIGTTSPSVELNVESTSGPSIHLSRDYSAGSFDATGWGVGFIGFGGQDADSGEDNDAAYIYGRIPTTAQGGGAWSSSSHPCEMSFYTTPSGATSATQRMLISAAGDVTVNTGDLIIGTAGKGISFAATADGTTMSSEVLSDYEEGIHTTAITGADTAGDFVLDSANQSLAYTKIGRMVTVQGKFQTSSGSGAGHLKISMPFTSNNGLDDSADISVGSITMNRTGSTSPSTQMTPIIFSNTAFVNIQLHNEGNANETYLQADDVDGTFEGQICISYIV